MGAGVENGLRPRPPHSLSCGSAWTGSAARLLWAGRGAGVDAPGRTSLTIQWSWECWSHSRRTGGKQVTIFCRQPWRRTGTDGKADQPCVGGDLQQAVLADARSGSRTLQAARSTTSRKPSLIGCSPSFGQSVVATGRSQPTNNSGISKGGFSPLHPRTHSFGGSILGGIKGPGHRVSAWLVNLCSC